MTTHPNNDQLSIPFHHTFHHTSTYHLLSKQATASMSTVGPQNPEGRDLIIFYNDLVDSDNTTAALALLRHRERRRPDAQIVWIIEPRQVALGLGMTRQEVADCMELIQKHFGGRGNPFKVLLGGLLSPREIDGVQEKLSEEQRKLVSFALVLFRVDMSFANLFGCTVAKGYQTVVWAEGGCRIACYSDRLGFCNLSRRVV